MNAYSKKLSNRFNWPSVCNDCKRTPLVYMEYNATYNMGCDWEDGNTETYCIPCLVKAKVRNLMWTAKKWMRNFIKFAAPLFFELLFMGKPIGKCWKVAKLMMKC